MGVMRWIDLPPVWLLGFAVLAWASAEADLRVGPTVAMQTAGVVLAVLAAGLSVWAAATLMSSRTTVVPHHAPTRLVTSGPFRWTRNPIYLSDLILAVAVCLYVGAVPALALVPLLGLLLTRRFIRPEEARLAALAGAAWEAYSSRVRRWL